jgi:hypothetical protein
VDLHLARDVDLARAEVAAVNLTRFLQRELAITEIRAADTPGAENEAGGKGAPVPFTRPFALPLYPKLLLHGFVIERCSVANSGHAALVLTLEPSTCSSVGFAGRAEGRDPADPEPSQPVSVIYKVGDDVRHDVHVNKMIRVAEQLWKRTLNVDPLLSFYRCQPTGADEGLIEVVGPAKSLAQIAEEHITEEEIAEKTLKRRVGGRGAFFDDRSWLKTWLEHQQEQKGRRGGGGGGVESPHLLFEAARVRYIRSNAAYCTLTYVLGLRDRHMSNILVRPDGRVFHVDFGPPFGTGFHRTRSSARPRTSNF